MWLSTKADTLSFRTTRQPDLINVDAQRVLVARITDHKTMQELLFQYTHAPLYLDRKQAIDAAMAQPDDPIAQQILMKALEDRYYGLRLAALHAIGKDDPIVKAAIPVIELHAQNDSNTLVRAAAIGVLGGEKNKKYIPLFDKALEHPSYAVEAAALLAIDRIDHVAAVNKARRLEEDAKGPLATAIRSVYVNRN